MRRFIVAGFLILTLPTGVRAQAGAPAALDTSRVRIHIFREFTDAARYGVTTPTRWSATSLRKLATAAAFVAVLTPLDARGRSLMLRNQSRAASDIASVVEPLGMEASVPIVAAMGLTGVLIRDPRLQFTAAEAAASSIVAGGIVTPVLKYAFGRARPREGKDPYDFRPFSGEASLPSGHTTQAFAIASVIATEYNEGWVRIPVYGLAAGVAVSRMYHGAHYLSDVAAGALIGTATGRAIARHGRESRASGEVRTVQETGAMRASHLRILPGVMPNGAAGVVMQLKY